ncbi:MAG: flagellar export protein FliJ [Bdellovibrionales bacterium]|nr:flagellar export protein FliJ [Bdellovibrionales bacterium]
MKFNFNLETVLKHRQRLEEAAQREFAEAQAAVNEVLQLIESMYQRMDEAREEILQAQKVGTPQKLEEARGLDEFVINQRRRIEYARLQARERMAVAEEKQELLITAAQEKKVLVKLKERRRREFEERMRMIEAKELDDMTMVRQAWGKK